MTFIRRLRILRSWNYSIIWVFFLMGLTIFGNFIANEKPIYANYKNQTYYPVLYDILYQMGLYRWDSELINKDWKQLPLESSLWALIPFSPTQLDMQNAPAGPPFSVLEINGQKFYHYLGTDELGRDIASGLVYGARYAIIIGLASTFIATVFGILIGSIAGFWGDHDFRISIYSLFILLTVGFWAFFMSFYSRSYIFADALSQSFFLFLRELFTSLLIFVGTTYCIWKLFLGLKYKFAFFQKYFSIPLDILISRLIEIKLSIPMLLLVIILTSIAKPSLLLLISIIAFGQWTIFARLIRAEILKIKNLDYVAAAKIQGFSYPKILLYHVIPNAFPPIWVSISFAIATAILVESALSFLGLGSNHISWGSILKSGRNNLNAWWLVLFPGFMIFFTILSFNNISQLLQKKFNPKITKIPN